MYRLGQQQGQNQPQLYGNQPPQNMGQDPRISQAASLPFPTEGQIKDTQEEVTFLQTCDWAGHSPSLIGVDKQGDVFIASFEESRVTDHRVVPNQNLRQLRQGNNR